MNPSRERSPAELEVDLVPPDLPAGAHKGDAGRVLSLCGSRAMPGAAILVARAALRAGAGLFVAACLDENLLVALPIAAPEVVLWDATKLEQWTIALASRNDHAAVIGPGLGTGPRARAALEGALESKRRIPLVIDADGLNLLAGRVEQLKQCPAISILTPHVGEAQRLLGREIASDDAARRAAALELARRSGAVACLKGPRTVVTDGEQLYVNDTGNWGLATAGAGDVLSGIMGAYAALCATGQHPGWTPLVAAAAAVRVHGLAGDLAAAHVGPRSVIASDLISALPSAQQRLKKA